MEIRVRFFARFREIFGPEVVIRTDEGSSLLGVIRAIASNDERRQMALFDEHGVLRRFVILMRNGRRIEHAEAESLKLEDGDEIAVLPPVAGG